MARRDFGHLVARRHQPEDAPFPQRAFADRVDVGIGGLAMGVDLDAAALAHGQAGRAGQLVARADSRGEHDQVGFEAGAIDEDQLVAARPAVDDFPGVLLQVDPGAQRLDLAPQEPAGGIVELHRHQARREFHDVGLEAEVLERFGGLQPEQPAADDRANPGARGGGRNDLEVLDRAVDEAIAPVPAGHRRHERIGAGGEHELVVRHLAIARRAHYFPLRVNGKNAVVQAQGHFRFLKKAFRHQA